MLSQRISDILDRCTDDTTVEDLKERMRKAIELDRDMQRLTPTHHTVTMHDDISLEAQKAKAWAWVNARWGKPDAV